MVCPLSSHSPCEITPRAEEIPCWGCVLLIRHGPKHKPTISDTHKARVVLTTADTTGSPKRFLLVVVVFQIYLKINLNSSVIQLFSIFNQFQAIGTKHSSVFIYTEQQFLPGTVIQPPHYPKAKSKCLLFVSLSPPQRLDAVH